MVTLVIIYTKIEEIAKNIGKPGNCWWC